MDVSLPLSDSEFEFVNFLESNCICELTRLPGQNLLYCVVIGIIVPVVTVFYCCGFFCARNGGEKCKCCGAMCRQVSVTHTACLELTVTNVVVQPNCGGKYPSIAKYSPSETRCCCCGYFLNWSVIWSVFDGNVILSCVWIHSLLCVGFMYTAVYSLSSDSWAQMLPAKTSSLLLTAWIQQRLTHQRTRRPCPAAWIKSNLPPWCLWIPQMLTTDWYSFKYQLFSVLN